MNHDAARQQAIEVLQEHFAKAMWGEAVWPFSLATGYTIRAESYAAAERALDALLVARQDEVCGNPLCKRGVLFEWVEVEADEPPIRQSTGKACPDCVCGTCGGEGLIFTHGTVPLGEVEKPCPDCIDGRVSGGPLMILGPTRVQRVGYMGESIVYQDGSLVASDAQLFIDSAEGEPTQ